MKYNYIERVFTGLDKLKENGIWYSGIKGKGEHKQWYDNGQLGIHNNYENCVKEGEYKKLDSNSQLNIHKLYKGEEVIK